ncbi:MAG: CBS domain-containing protein [Bacteroidetes bacterium]|nr:CBS domain-containing protein [Bacteroidota bacterium]MBP7398859.1 CBS domain-containing protein [Chitinophagales bacterium]MBK7109481.1 CBS domain-containing protein [Bacteroidota bacterium]MBK8487780.1 CBS domain-containing protein [Bacteroidota bacterium]MBK8682465.1 CBS domain-containing protein [Bacteroidota bacterium]
MPSKKLVNDIMTSHVITINESDDLHEATQIFRRNHIRHIPVVKDGHITGILSRTDLNRLSFGALMEEESEADESILNMLTIPQIMSRKPVTINPKATVKKVAEIFATEDFHALPVVENDVVVGIVTTTDVIKYLLEILDK